MTVFDRVSISVGEEMILRNITFDLDRGDRLAVIGASGTGKSTLLKLLAKVLDETQFSITGIIHRPVSNFGMIFQEPRACLNPLNTVRTAFFQLRNLPHRPVIDDARIETLLAMVNLHASRRLLHSYPHQLSGGIAQRVMVALVLACGYDWILADEVSSALDKDHEYELLQLLDTHAQCLVLVTHRLHLLSQFCNKVLLLKDKELAFYGTVSEFSRTSLVKDLKKHSLQQGSL